MKTAQFDWDDEKERLNREKHGLSFFIAQKAFSDPRRVVAEDTKHSSEENRFYCIGKVDDGIITVRFTFRDNIIRIFGAGYWRKGKKIYEEKNKLQE
ncbi:MAG: BrnT family toxin [Bacteroidales bacterium]|nr:BrnT family toxin [Bacteroidales bacterium]